MNHGLHVALGEKICFLKIFADIGKKLIDFTRIKHWTNYKITNWMGQS